MRWRRHRVLPQFATGTVLRLCVSARQDGFLMCTKQCLMGTVPNVVFDGLMVSRFLSGSSVSVNHFGLGSERGQLCVSWQWGGSACVLPCHLACYPYHPSAGTNHIGHSVAATLLGSIGTDMCGLRSPHKYRCCRGILILIPGLRCSSLSSSLYVFWYCGILDELWVTGAVSRLGEFGGLAEFKSSSAVSAHPS